MSVKKAIVGGAVIVVTGVAVYAVSLYAGGSRLVELPKKLADGFRSLAAQIPSSLGDLVPGGATDKVKALAEAIARAEGFYRSDNPVPVRANNPGAIVGTPGKTLYGFPVLDVANSAGVAVFASVEQGWSALYQLIERMASGAHSSIKPHMSLREVARIYTGNDNPDTWAGNVARQLGVDVSTTLREYFS